MVLAIFAKFSAQLCLDYVKEKLEMLNLLNFYTVSKTVLDIYLIV